MAYKSEGVGGEVQVGGRVAVKLGKWELKSIGGGAWICEASATLYDEYWATMPTPKELRLFVGNKVQRFRNVQLGGAGDSVTIAGTGVFELQERG